MTGGSSFIITLPKEWILRHRIKKNDTLGLLAQPDGNLLITPKLESDDFIKEIKIDADEYNDVNFLFRALIGAYITGYSRMIVISSKRFEPTLRECISNFTQIAIGPEIMEETSNMIIIKDLVNPKEMPFEKTIRRMYVLVGAMHIDAMSSLSTKNSSLAEDVIKKDNEIDRLHWLVGRQSHMVLRDIMLCQKMGITLEQAYQYHQMSRFLERIGDHAVKIAINVLKIKKQSIDNKIIKNLAEASKVSMVLLDNSMDAWRNKDIKMANQNIELISDLIKLCEEISLNPNNENVETFIALSYIVESIRRTGEYAGDISEIIINNLISR